MSTIRRPIQIAAPTRLVWNTLLSTEGITRWLGSAGRVDPREGGRFTCTLASGDEVTGIINAWRPTAKAEVLFDKRSAAPWGGTTLTISVARDANQSAVHVLHGGGALDDDAVSAPLDALWKTLLTALRDALETSPASPTAR